MVIREIQQLERMGYLDGDLVKTILLERSSEFLQCHIDTTETSLDRNFPE